MRTTKIELATRTATGAALLAALLVGCAKPVPPLESAPPAPMAPAAQDAPPPAEAVPAPDTAPSASVQPEPVSPSTTALSAAQKPAAESEPALESMGVATPSAKMSVAVDLRYSFETAVLPNQTATLHLAAVPRVDGTNVSLSIKEIAGVQLAAGPLSLQKANGSNVYRRQFSVTRGVGAPSELRVLVTMDMAAGSGFGFFSIPLDAGTTPQKQDSIKQR